MATNVGIPFKKTYKRCVFFGTIPPLASTSRSFLRVTRHIPRKAQFQLASKEVMAFVILVYDTTTKRLIHDPHQSRAKYS